MRNLLSGISKANSALLEIGDLHSSLQNVVTALGQGTRVDRCYIFTNRKVDGELRLFYTEEWCKDGVEPQLGNEGINNITYADIPWLYDNLSAGRSFYGFVRESDNVYFKEVMEMQGIITYLFVPVFCNDDFWGWMGYDNCTDERVWEPEEVDALTTVARNIGLRLNREKAEEENTKALERFDLSIKGSQQGLWEWDILNDVIHYSAIFMEMIGYTHYEFAHTYENWKCRMHPDDYALVEPVLMSYLNHESNAYSTEFRLLHKKGHYVWIKGSGVAKWDASGKPLYMMGSHLDISELKLQQEYLEVQRNDFDRLLNSLGEAVFRLNSNNELTFLNDFWQDISGYEPKECISKLITGFFQSEDISAINENIELLKSEKVITASLEIRLNLKNGKWRWVQIMMKEYGKPNDQEYFIAGSIIDIHDRKLTQEKEKELADMKAGFVSVASHQFRTPLTVIFTNVELIEILTSKCEIGLIDKIQQKTDQIKNEIDRMTALMNNILLVGRYDAGQIQFNQKILPVSPLIHAVVQNYFSQRSDGRKLKINESILSDRKGAIDEMLLTHVLTNLISNAFNYSEGGGDPELEIIYHNDDVEVCIKDYGIGIPEDELEKVFNSFYRAANTVSFRGSGLGLVVAKQFVELHNGSIKLESRLNVGTKAVFTLPLVPEE